MLYPTHVLFTRQQLGELTGISDDVLGYWMRESLLVPVSAAGNGRKHRRFGFVQLHIAVILNELRRYGTNIEGLRRFAMLMQAANRDGHSLAGYDKDLLWEITELANQRSREPGTHPEHFVTGSGDSQIEHTSFESWLSAMRERWPERFSDVGVERSLDPRLQDLQFARHLDIYADLISIDHLRLRTPGRSGEWFWMITPTEDDSWHIAGAEDGYGVGGIFAEVTSYISINVSRLIRRIWVPEGDRA